MTVLMRVAPLLWLLSAFAVLAPAPVHGAKQPSPTTEPAAPVKMDDPVVLSLGARLRCPVCQGMPIGESPAPMAQDMMREVRRMRLEEGLSESHIAQHFTDRYGTWVLLDPPTSGFGLLVWLLPPAALLLGVGAALGSLAHKRAVARGGPPRGRAAAGEAPSPTTAADQEALLEQVRKQVRS